MDNKNIKQIVEQEGVIKGETYDAYLKVRGVVLNSLDRVTSSFV